MTPLGSAGSGWAWFPEIIVALTYLPVRKPRPRGAYATIATPSSRAVLSRPIFSSSMSSVKGEYSTSSAAMGWTACARRRVAAEHSEIPRYLTLPCLQKSVSVRFTGLTELDLLDEFCHRADGDLQRESAR